MRTICEIINETLLITNDEKIKRNILDIKQQAIRMENRLLKYCNAMEDLGFKRIGRDYDNQ